MSIKLEGRSTCPTLSPQAAHTLTHAQCSFCTDGRTDVRTYGRRVNHVTTKFSRLHGLLPYFFRYGAPLRGPSARWRSSAKNVITRLPMIFTFPLSGNMVLTCYARSRKIAFALENKITIFALRVIFSICFLTSLFSH